MYAACAVVFILLSGPLLHRLIAGPGSLRRFYLIFSPAFLAYALAWIAGWMLLRGSLGGIVGLFAGTALMGIILSRAFAARGAAVKVSLVLFVANAAGYFTGGFVEQGIAHLKDPAPFGLALSAGARMTIAMLLWGVWYGIGFGAGLGYAFQVCQANARELASASDAPRQP